MIRNRIVALVFRACAFLFALSGLLSQMGLFRGEMSFSSIMYYTIQSNILAVFLFGILTVRTAMALREGIWGTAGYLARFEMVCMIDLLLTFLVYWFMLAPGSFSMNSDYSLWTFDNLAVHGITPLLCMVDYLLFTESGHMKYRDNYYVCIYPLCYVAFSSAAGLMGYVYRISAEDGGPVRFPYYFFDFDRIGAQSFLYIAALVVIFVLISHLFYLLDKKVKKPVLFPRKSRT